MKGKNFLRILLALCMTGMPGIALTGCGETPADPNGGGGGGSQEQQHNVDFEVKNGTVFNVKNDAFGNVEFDDITLPKTATSIFYRMDSSSEVRKLTIPKNIQKIVDSNGVPCTNEYLMREFSLFDRGCINEIVVEEGNIAFSMKNGCLMYNGVLIYATPKIAESESLEINTEKVADRAFYALRDMSGHGEFSGKFKLKNLVVDFNNNNDSNVIRDVLDILNGYNENRIEFDSLELKNIPSSGVDLRDVNAGKVIISGDNIANVQLGGASSIEIKEGLVGFQIYLQNSNNITVSVPASLKYQSSIDGCESIEYNIPLTHLEFEDKRYYELINVYNYEDTYSYKVIGLKDNLSLNSSITLKFKAHTASDESKVEFYKHFKYEVSSSLGGVVVTGVYGSEPDNGFVIPDKIGDEKVVKVVFNDSEEYISGGYLYPTYGISKITLPSTLKQIECNSSNYYFEEIVFDGTKEECKNIRAELMKLSDYISGSTISCSDGTYALGVKVFENSSYSFTIDGDNYIFNADFTNNSYELILNSTYKTHQLFQDFSENRLYLYIDNQDYHKQIVLKRQEEFDSETDSYYYDVAISEDDMSFVSAKSRQAFLGTIEHEYHEVVINSATCNSEGWVEDKCTICGEVRDSHSLPMLDHSIITDINDEHFGYCQSGCGSFKLGTIASGSINGVEYKELTISANDGNQKYRNQITELAFPSGLTAVQFDGNLKTLFPNLTSVCVSSVKDYLMCSFNTGDKPLSNGVVLKVKNVATSQFELLENLVINDALFEGVDQSNGYKINDYAFYGYSGLKSLTIQTSDSITLNVGAYAFADTGLENINIHSKYASINSNAFTGSNRISTIERITTAESSISSMIALINENPNALKKDLIVYTGNSDFSSLGKFENAYIELRKGRYSSSDDRNIESEINADNVYIENLETWLGLVINGIYDSPINIKFKNGDSYVGITEINFNNGSLSNVENSVYNDNAFNINGLTKVTFSSALSSTLSQDMFGKGIQEITAPASVVRYISGSAKKLNVVGDSTTILAGENNHPLPGLFEEINLSKEITTIGGGTFWNNTTLKSINLENVQVVGASAFSGCTSLESVGASHQLTEIANYSFQNCSSLENFNLCNITKVGTQAFKGCSNLTISSSFKNITEIASKAFAGLKVINELDLSGLTGSFESDAFDGTGVNDFIVNTYDSSYGITPLRKLVVKSCNGLISLPNDDACLNLEIHLPSGVSKIFGYSKANWNVYFDGNVEDWAKITITNGGIANLYIDNNQLEDVVLENVETIGNAFEGLKSLKTLLIRNAKSIGSFANCSNLTSVIIENSTNTSEMSLNATFENCTKLNSFSCSDKISLLNTFAGCSNLKTLIIPNATRNTNSSNRVLNGIKEFDRIEASSDFLYYLNSNELNSSSKISVQNLVIGNTKANYVGSSLANIKVGNSLVFAEGSESVYGVSGSVKEITIPSSVTVYNESLFNSLADTSTIKFGFDINTYASKDYYRSFFALTNNIKFRNGEDFESIPASLTFSGITKIGKNAFNGATGISSITIPSGIQIDNTALRNMSGLTSLTILENCSYNEKLLEGCSNLQTLTISECFESLGSMFGGSIPTTLNKVDVQSWREVNGKKVIPENMFNGFAKEIVLSDNYNKISANAFNGTNIASLIISNSCTEISEGAFNGMENLTELSLPNNCTYSSSIISNCTKLEKLTLPNALYSVKEIFGGVIPSTLRELTISSWENNGKKVIPNGMFENLTGITLNYSSDYTAIGNNAFKGTEITSINISETCESIGDNAFVGTNLISITIPESVKTIGASAFEGISTLKTLSISDACKTIGNKAFKGIGISSLVLKSGVEIGDEAFAYISSLETLTIESGCTKISNRAFKETGVKSLTIPDSVVEIGESAFENCLALTEVTFDGFSQAKTFNAHAFKGSVNIGRTYINDSNINATLSSTKWLDSTFKALDEENLSVSDGDCNPTYYSKNLLVNNKDVESVADDQDAVDPQVVSNFALINVASIKGVSLYKTSMVGSYAFYGCTNISNVKITNGVGEISSYAFANCEKLKTLELKATGSIGAYAFFGNKLIENLDINVGGNIGEYALAGASDGLSVTNKLNFVCKGDVASTALKYHNNIKEAVVNIEGSFDGLLDEATKLYKIELTSSNGYKFGQTFTDLQYLTYRLSGNLSLSNLKKVDAPNIKTIAFVGSGNLSITGGAFSVHKLYMLQFGNLDGGSSNVGITSIADTAFATGNLKPKLYEILNTTTKDLSNPTFCTKLNYATSLDNSKMVFAQNYDGVYFKTTYQKTNGGTAEDVYQLVDFREDNRISYEFYDTIASVTDIYGKTVELGTIKVLGGLFGFNQDMFSGTERKFIQNGSNSTIKSIKVSPGVAELNGLNFFTALESVEYKDGTTSIAGFVRNGLTSYGEGSSNGLTTLKSVKLPSTVTNLKASAFEGCRNLETFETPNNTALQIVDIPEKAFMNCTKLKDLSMIISDSTEEIGLDAFKNTGVVSVVLGSSLSKLGGSAFENCHSLKTLTFKSNFNIGEIRYGSDTKNSGYFVGCENLETISSFDMGSESGIFSKGNCLYRYNSADNTITLMYIAKNGSLMDTSNSPYVNVTDIGNFAFENYYGNKTEWTLPSSVKNIREGAFYGSNITKLIFDSVQIIENQAFANSQITTITTSNDLTFAGIKFSETLTSIGASAFANCTAITSVVLPSSITEISSSLFLNSSISSIEMPSVQIINTSAFKNTTNLTSINFKKALQSIDAEAFKDSSVSTIDFEAGIQLTSIGISAFENTNVNNVVLPESLETIANSMFKGCEQLTTIDLKNVKKIEAYAFANSKVTGLNLAKLTNIGAYAFEGTNLKDISSLSEKLNIIGEYAFSNTKLTKVVLPSAIQSIGKEAFGGLTAVKEIITPFLGSTRLSATSDYETEKQNGYESGLSYLFGTNYCKNIDKLEIISTKNDANVQFNLSDLEDAKVNSLILTKYVTKIIDSNSNKYVDKNKRFDELKYGGSFMDWCSLTHTVDSAPAQITDNLYYSNNGEYVLIEGVVSIGTQGSVNTFTMGDGKFKGYDKITGVEFVQSGTVGVSAFEDTEINSITLGENVSDAVIRLSSRAFKNTKIISIDLSFMNFVKDDEGVSKGEQFANNTLLESVSNVNLWNISKVNSTYVFSGCSKLGSAQILDEIPNAPTGFTNWFSYFYLDASTSYQIPEGTFKDCGMLTQVELPTNIEKVGKSAFENCNSLTSVSFKFNKSNAYMEVAKNYTYGKYLLIGENAFANCSNLQTLTFNGVWGYANASNSSKHSYFGNYYIEGKGTTGAQDSASDSYGLIGFKSKAFLNCSKLARVNYIGSLTDDVLTSGANQYNSNLANLWIENMFEVNGTFASNMNDILSANPLYYGAKLYVGESLDNATAITEISGRQVKATAWAGSGIEKAVINDVSDLTSKLLFVNCKNLNTVEFATWNSIGVVYENNVAFRGCSNLTTITLCDELKNGLDNNNNHWTADNGLLTMVSSDGEVKELYLAFGNSFDDSLITRIHEYAFVASGLKEITLSTLESLPINAITYSEIENIKLSSSEGGVWRLKGTGYVLNYVITNPDNLKDEMVVAIGGNNLSVIDWLKMGAYLEYSAN